MAAAAVVLVLGSAACSSSDPQPNASGPDDRAVVGLSGGAPVLLRAEQSCDQVLEDFQELAPDVLESQFGFGIAGDGAEGGAELEEGASFDDSGGDAAVGAPLAGEAQRSSAEDSAAGGAGDSSDTNNQEEGVDEPDVVENDGEHVYLVDMDQLLILDGASAAVVGRVQLAGHGAQIMLSGDRILAVVGGGHGIGFAGPGVAIEDNAGGGSDPVLVDPLRDDAVAPDEPASSPAQPTEPGPLPEPEPVPEPLPGPEPRPIEPPSFQAGTVLQIVDVSQPSAPTVVETTEIEGVHVSSRLVDGVARVVVSSYPQPPQLFDMPVSSEEDGSEAIRETVAATTVEDWLPAFRTTTASAEPAATTTVEGSAVACGDVLVPEVNAGLAETSILRVDLTEGFDPEGTTTVVADAGTVYASASTLYIAATRYVSPEGQGEVSPDDWSTAIHAFDLASDGPAAHIGAGEVPGSTLNQYSLSEHDGHLRIATTEGTPWGGGGQESESAVRVLRLQGDQLTEVGVVGGLGRTETIQSVRFMGPVGYVVTFRQTDPLYVIDLSDPTSPQAVGELKIPGFSSYLHPVGDGRLLGIGRDATLEGQDQGLLVSLFDVSDPTAPKQIQTYTEREAYSAAGNDPKAFLWWAPESAAVVPIERYGAPTAELPEGFSYGMTVLDVSDSGITERATITAGARYPSRSLVVQGRLWSLFDGGVVTSDFDAPAQGSFTSFR